MIQENIKKPLAEELLFGKLAKGGLVKVAVENDEIVLPLSHEGLGGGTALRHVDGIAGRTQRLGELRRDDGLVLDDQHAHDSPSPCVRFVVSGRAVRHVHGGR